MPTHLIIMGVSASGKTTVAELIDAHTGVPYAEADEFHPAANKEKMASGEPLTDDDRWPWLHELRDWMTAQATAGHSTIVTCSALKKSYRDVLREAEGEKHFVLLDAPQEVLAERMAARKGHFMPVSLLRSQLDTLETLTSDEDGWTVDATATPEEIAREVLELVGDFGDAVTDATDATAGGDVAADAAGSGAVNALILAQDATQVLAQDAATASDGQLVVAALVGIALIVALIVWAKLNPFLALMIGSVVLALVAGIPLVDSFVSFTAGFGGTIGSVGVLIALGAVIGQFLVKSGAADSIVDAFLDRTPPALRPWVIAGLAMLLGIPLFFEVGIVLLIPVVMLAARRSQLPVMVLGIPALAGLSALHALVPPHPGPLIAVDALNANLGLTLALGLLVSVPVVAIAGPLSAKLMARWVPIPAPTTISGQDITELSSTEGPKPSVGRGLTVILLPVVMMLSRTLVESLQISEDSAVFTTFEFLGEPIVALLATVLLAMYFLGFGIGRTRQEVSDQVGSAFGPIAGVILIVGAGGGFKETLVDTGVADVVGQWVQDAPVSPLVAGWLVAVFIRLATGSATVATVTAAGIMAPVVTDMGSVEVALMVLAIGAGSVFFSHVNDAGFWLVKEYFGMTVPQTLKTWSLMETVLSVVALGVVLLLNLII